MTAYLRFTALTAVLLLQACATNTVSQRYPSPEVTRAPPSPSVERVPPRTAPLPSTPSTPAPPSEPARVSDSPAVIALLDRAETQQHQSHDVDAAAVSLERALRIEPRNPVLWQRMANLRLEQGQWDQAVQMAARSNSYAGRYSGLRARNWQIIAAARRAQGDVQGAADAELKARQLE